MTVAEGKLAASTLRGGPLPTAVVCANDLLALSVEFGLAGVHTAMTLWYRLPMFAASYGVAGAGQPEFGRMVSEKAAAAVEGAWDAHVEAMRLTRDAMTRVP